jgi:hypothetical protein
MFQNIVKFLLIEQKFPFRKKWSWDLKRLAVAQVICCGRIVIYSRVQFQAGTLGIYGSQTGTGRVFSPNTSIFFG